MDFIGLTLLVIVAAIIALVVWIISLVTGGFKVLIRYITGGRIDDYIDKD